MVAKSISHDERVTIVGGGITGLAAALFLLLSGHTAQRITVLEKSARWGGHSRTLYLFKDSAGHTRLVSSYHIDVEDSGNPLLRPSDPSEAFLSRFPAGQVSLLDPGILPIDTAFSIFTSRYHNYRELLGRHSSFPVIDTSLKSNIKRSYHLNDDVFLESDLPLYGLWRRPFRFLTQLPQLLALKGRMRGFLDSVESDELESMTVAELRASEGLDGTIFGDLISAMVALYSGFSRSHLMRTSARYFVDFLRVSNMEGEFRDVTTTLLGNSLSAYALQSDLERDGVQMELNAPSEAEARAQGATLFAVHPWLVPDLDALPFETVSVPVYLNTSQWGHQRADVHYCDTVSLSHATLDIDKYRPHFPSYGVQITFGVTGQDEVYERKIRDDAAEKGVELEVEPIESYHGQRVDEHPVKVVWDHAFVTPDFERARRTVSEMQGVGKSWYASSSLVRSARHEDGVTSALDAVILMKGLQAWKTLTEEGFSPGLSLSDFQSRWGSAS